MPVSMGLYARVMDFAGMRMLRITDFTEQKINNNHNESRTKPDFFFKQNQKSRIIFLLDRPCQHLGKLLFVCFF